MMDSAALLLREPATGRPGLRDVPPRPSSPLIDRVDHGAPSVFRPENMLREARRQKGLASGRVPAICVLDPDGDIVTHLRQQGVATSSPHWACYHTQMWTTRLDGPPVGFVGCAVGGAFAVLVAEQLFASGCELVISLSSAGRIDPLLEAPSYVLLDRAIRDEGTSHHYLPPARFADADTELLALAAAALRRSKQPFTRGTSWTTDAPFRETERAIQERLAEGAMTVEMEAASLYAFAAAGGHPVLCLAHVTNELGRVENDFEKGEFNGARASLAVIGCIADAWMARR